MLRKFGRGYVFRKNVFSSKRILEKNFITNSKFNFIQVGANDGISFDFLYDFVINRQSSGIVLEPVKKYFEELKLNYSRLPEVITVNLAIHPSLKQLDIYRIKEESLELYPDWVRGIASFDKNHHKKTNIDEKDIEAEKIEAETLRKIYNDYGRNLPVDYFQIDTEGFDFEVLKMIDFEQVTPSMIKYESVNLNEDDKNSAEKLLIDKGFFLFIENGDTVGLNIRKLAL